MPSFKIAVAGATGAAGVAIINELLRAKHYVTALSRIGSMSSSKLPKHPNLSVVEVDYDSFHSLTSALQGHKVVVASLPVATPVGSQNMLIDASVAAGVTRYFPSEFGTDTENPKCIELPVFANKIQALDYLKSKASSNPHFSYTALCAGLFLDWGLEVGFIVNVKTHSATIYDWGDHPFSATTLGTVGKAISSVIAHLEETENRHVYIQDVALTQNELVAIAKKLDGKDWHRTHTQSTTTKSEAISELKKENSDITRGLFPLLQISAFGEGYGGDFSAHLDNKLLGIDGMDYEELEDLVARYL
jgi:hypothetical protein